MLSIPRNCDVVVIGGGPAGTTAATRLAQNGYSVVLFDRERHPRYRVGESLIPHAWKYTDLTGASDKVREEGFLRKAGGTVVWNGVIRQMTYAEFGYRDPALHIERDRYDFILLEHARSQGVQAFEEVVVVRADLRGADAPVDVVYRATDTRGDDGCITCRFVVDASGQSAVLGKQLGTRVTDEGFRFMGLWGYFTGSKYVSSGGVVHPFEDLRDVPPTTFVSSLDALGDWGWMWHIPLRESTSVGLVIPREYLGKDGRAAGLRSFFLDTVAGIPYLDRLLENAQFVEGSLHAIRNYSYSTTPMAGPGYFLIGDAGAFVDPIFSVGVVIAMYGGYLASWAIDRSLRRASSTERNQAIFAGQLRGRLEVARSLALPRYAARGGVSALARDVVRFESSLERELMYVVSNVTTRSDNMLEMTRGLDEQRITSPKYRTLDGLQFGPVAAGVPAQ